MAMRVRVARPAQRRLALTPAPSLSAEVNWRALFISQESTLSHGERLEGWKAIARFLGRGVRTVQRWERTLNIPIYRHGEAGRSPVHASCVELRRWTESRWGGEPPGRPGAGVPRVLRGWKEIAAFLGVSVSTAQRYRRQLGLPVDYPRGVRVPCAHPEQLSRWYQGSNETQALPPGCSVCLQSTIQTLIDCVGGCTAILEPPSAVVALSNKFRSMLSASDVPVGAPGAEAPDFVRLISPLLENSSGGAAILGRGLQQVLAELRPEFQMALGQPGGAAAGGVQLRFRRAMLLGRSYILVQCAEGGRV